jgi:hypothetical protein
MAQIVDPNSDFELRDRILFGNPIDWQRRKLPPGCSERFDKLDLDGLETLLKSGFILPQSTMNGTPKVQDFADFLRTMRSQSIDFYLEGFTFDPRYENAGFSVALEGVRREGNYSAEIGFAFAQFVAPWKPDELSLEPELLRAWWD